MAKTKQQKTKIEGITGAQKRSTTWPGWRLVDDQKDAYTMTPEQFIEKYYPDCGQMGA